MLVASVEHIHAQVFFISMHVVFNIRSANNDQIQHVPYTAMVWIKPEGFVLAWWSWTQLTRVHGCFHTSFLPCACTQESCPRPPFLGGTDGGLCTGGEQGGQ